MTHEDLRRMNPFFIADSIDPFALSPSVGKTFSTIRAQASRGVRRRSEKDAVNRAPRDEPADFLPPSSPLAPLAPHQPRSARDAADALERGGVVRAELKTGARAAERNPARGPQPRPAAG